MNKDQRETIVEVVSPSLAVLSFVVKEFIRRAPELALDTVMEALVENDFSADTNRSAFQLFTLLGQIHSNKKPRIAAIALSYSLLYSPNVTELENTLRVLEDMATDQPRHVGSALRRIASLQSNHQINDSACSLLLGVAPLLAKSHRKRDVHDARSWVSYVGLRSTNPEIRIRCEFLKKELPVVAR